MEACSMDLRPRVIAACDGGLGVTEVAERFSLHRATIHRRLQRRRQTGSIASHDQHTGHKRKLDGDAHDRLARWVRQDGNVTIAQLQARLIRPVSASTIGWALRRKGITFRAPNRMSFRVSDGR